MPTSILLSTRYNLETKSTVMTDICFFLAFKNLELLFYEICWVFVKSNMCIYCNLDVFTYLYFGELL